MVQASNSKGQKSSMKSGCCRHVSRTISYSAAVIFSIFFIWIFSDHVKQYLEYATVTSVERKPVKDLQFPAFTICTSQFDYKRLSEDLKFPRNPFNPVVKEIERQPANVYRQLEEFNLKTSNFVWKYYYDTGAMVKTCEIGGSSCVYPKNISLPEGDSVERVAFVNGGKWVSRILADSAEGFNFMCHTLVPNVTVDFGIKGGNALALSWAKEFSSLANNWYTYVHDLNEHPLLRNYAMDQIPYTTISQRDEENDLKLKKKAQILTKKFINPDTDHHKCNSSKLYSENLCELRFCWSRRFKTMRNFYKENFTCQLPGIKPEPRDLIPVCNHYEASADEKSLGLINLLNSQTYQQGVLDPESKQGPTLTKPSIGAELPSNCLPRCMSYSYQIYHEEISAADEDILNNDLFFYFTSNYVEVWHEYESYSAFQLFSDVGGTMGLLLGMSLLTIVEMIVDLVEKVIFQVGKLCDSNKSF